MCRSLGLFVLLLLAHVLGSVGTAQSPSPQGHTPAPVLDASAVGDQVTLDHDWLFHPGDDPGFASPTLDDRAWLHIDLGRSLPSYGFAGLRYGWYRLHVHLRPGTPDTAFAATRTLGRYQIFANGQLITTVGDLRRHDLYDIAYITPYPVTPTPSGDLVLAVRVSLQLTTYTGAVPESLFAIGSPLLGTIRGLAEAGTAQTVLEDVPYAINAAPAFITALVALALFLSLRTHREYLLLAVYALAQALLSLEQLWSWITPYSLPVTLIEYALTTLVTVGLFEFVRETLHLHRARWMLLVEILFVVVNAIEVLWSMGYLRYWTTTFAALATALFFGLVFVLLFRAARAGNFDARLLLPGVLLSVFSHIYDALRAAIILLHPGTYLSTRIHLGIFGIEFDTIADFLVELSLLVFLTTRTVRIARERNRAAAELEAARSVQQVLVPEHTAHIPGLTIHTAYHPAQEVGGDFFQILPLPTGGTLVVIGDVAGKGMPAALTVSLLVGTLRTLAEFTGSPAEILAHLNRRLYGRGPGFTTCLALRIDPPTPTRPAQLTLANAGHLPPYWNGRELSTAPALPLGVAPDVTFSEQTLPLGPGDHLTLLTDGVPEATQQRELFGFDRTLALTREPAHTIADAARAFGQTDDITVLTLDLQPSQSQAVRA